MKDEDYARIPPEFTYQSTPWNFTKDSSGQFLHDPCAEQWFGIMCDHSNTTIRYLIVVEVSGKLPSDFYTSFPNLQVLYVWCKFWYDYQIEIAQVEGKRPRGRLPNNFGAYWPDLERLAIKFCYQEGRFEDLKSIGNMRRLEEFVMNGNFFQGDMSSLFRQLSTMDRLWMLELGSSHGEGLGVIPSTIGVMTQLKMINMWQTKLQGSLPNELNLMTNLQGADFGNNALTGPIPRMDGLSQLKYFNVGNNLMSLYIPTVLATFTNLQALDLHNNSFSGPLPSELGLMTNLRMLTLGNNTFTGTIPASIGDLSLLEYLHLSNNRLEGSFPTTIGRLSRLKDLMVSSNYFSSALPPQMASMVSLKLLDASDNYFSSSVPSWINELANLTVLNLARNWLSGSIPPLQKLDKLSVLNLAKNSLQGLIPSSISRLRSLVYLILSNNQLSNGGAWSFIDPDIQKNLQVVDIVNNVMTGMPMPLFALPALRSLYAASNCFQGTLDDRVCKPDLRTLILDGMSSSPRCLLTYFPEAENDDNSLNDDDDYQSGHTMKDDTASADFSFFRFNGKYSSHKVGGLIPSCLWSLPSLEVLQLSGNGFSGSLSGGFNFSAKLSKLSIKNNRLQGTIPDELLNQMSQFDYLDLSFNRLRGTLDAVRVRPDKIIIFRANNNRLSGSLPNDLIRLSQPAELSVLDGNLFSCPSDAFEWSLLTYTDPFSRNYQCGSAQFDRYFSAYYLVVVALFGTYWYVLYKAAKPGIVNPESAAHSGSGGSDAAHISPFVLSFFDLSTTWFRISPLVQRLKRGVAVLDESSHSSIVTNTTQASTSSPVIARFLAELDDLKLYCQAMCVIFLVLLMPVYGAFSVYQSDLFESYSYAVSAAFKEGMPATVILFILWWMSVGINVSLFSFAFGHKKRRKDFNMYSRMIRKSALEIKCRVGSSFAAIRKEYRDQRVESHHLFVNLRLFIRLVLIAAINVSSAMIVNIGFVFLVNLQKTSKPQQIVLKIFVATFKVFSNLTMIPFTLKSRILQLGVERSTIERAGTLRGDDVFHSSLIIFNFIIAPCIALAMMDSTCFKNVINEPPDLMTRYQLNSTLEFPYYSIKDENGQGSLQLILGGLDREYPEYFSMSRYKPEFFYGHLCSSTVIVLYAPVFLVSCIISGLLPIFKNWLWRRLLDALRDTEGVKNAAFRPAESTAGSRATGDSINTSDSMNSASVSAPAPALDSASASASVVTLGCWAKLRVQYLDRLVWSLLIHSSPKGYLSKDERRWRDQQKLRKILDRRLPVSTFDEVHDSMVNVRSFYRQTLNDFVLLVTFGTACPMLGMAAALTIYFRVTRWKRLIETLVDQLEAKRLGAMLTNPINGRPSSLQSVSTTGRPTDAQTVRTTSAKGRGYAYDNREEVTLLEEDILEANGGDKSSHPLYTSRWFVLLLSSGFWQPFLVDISGVSWVAFAFFIACVLPFALRKSKLHKKCKAVAAYCSKRNSAQGGRDGQGKGPNERQDEIKDKDKDKDKDDDEEDDEDNHDAQQQQDPFGFHLNCDLVMDNPMVELTAGASRPKSSQVDEESSDVVEAGIGQVVKSGMNRDDVIPAPSV